MAHRARIRHIKTSYDGRIVAVAEFERTVQIWDIESQRRIADFETTLDFGGSRLAISRDGKHCAAGAYNTHGVALYDANGGREVWRRKDLTEVQKIGVSLDGQRLSCGFEGKPFQQLNLTTGESESSLKGVTNVIESVYDDLMVVDREQRDYQLVDADFEQLTTIPRTTFAALAFAFAPKKICVSESGGSIRCYDVSHGQQIWEYNPGNGIYALELVYNEQTELFAAIVWPYKHGGDFQLVSLHPDDGRIVANITISGPYTFAFCGKGSSLISSDGKIRNSSTGEVEGVLDFFPEAQ